MAAEGVEALADPALRRAGAETLVPNAESVATRRAYLNEKFGRTGDVNVDINVRGNQAVASAYFRSKGLSEADANSLMTGIDFTQPVEVQMLGTGKRLWQYQSPGAPQGNWYSLSPNVTPSELGIGPFGVNRAAQAVELKVLNQYRTVEPVEVLRSTSASVVDFWSVPGQRYSTVGGARQLYSPHKQAFLLWPH